MVEGRDVVIVWSLEGATPASHLDCFILGWGVPVVVQDWPVDHGTVCVGPRCQCPSQTTMKRMRKTTVCGAKLRVPEWVVVGSARVKVEAIHDLLDCSPRYRTLEMEGQAPARLQKESRFVRSANSCRCVVDRSDRLAVWACLELLLIQSNSKCLCHGTVGLQCLTT